MWLLHNLTLDDYLRYNEVIGYSGATIPPTSYSDIIRHKYENELTLAQQATFVVALIHANSQLVGRVSLTNDEPIPLLTLDSINTNALDPDVHDLLKEALSYINAGLIVANEGDETARASLSDTHAINVYGADVAEFMMENAGLVQALAFGGIGSGMLFSPDSSWGVGV
jgi:hypothetical protein